MSTVRKNTPTVCVFYQGYLGALERAILEQDQKLIEKNQEEKNCEYQSDQEYIELRKSLEMSEAALPKLIVTIQPTLANMKAKFNEQIKSLEETIENIKKKISDREKNIKQLSDLKPRFLESFKKLEKTPNEYETLINAIAKDVKKIAAKSVEMNTMKSKFEDEIKALSLPSVRDYQDLHTKYHTEIVDQLWCRLDKIDHLMRDLEVLFITYMERENDEFKLDEDFKKIISIFYEIIKLAPFVK